MQSRTILVLILAVVCAASAALGVNQILKQVEANSKLETTTIVVARRDVPRGGILHESLLTVREWPTKLVPAGVMTSVEQVKERTVAVPVVKDEPILAGKLVEGSGHGSLAGMIEPGMRAFTVSTPHSASGVGGFVEPGNRVDVLLTTTSQREDGSGGASTTTLLQNIQVLAVDKYLDAIDDKEVNQHDVKTVTLLVTPNQAAKLSLAANKGTLNLSLRHPDDMHESEATPATFAELRLHQDPLQTARSSLVLKKVATGVLAAMSQATVARPEGAIAAAPQKAAARVSLIQTLRGNQTGYVQVRK